MTDKVTLHTLADCCEAAEGVHRELDAAIRRAVYGDFGFCGDHDGTTYHSECPPEGCGKPVSMCDDRTSHPSDWREDEALPCYIASLDAAMTLVPKGMEVSLYWGVEGFKPEAQLETEAMRRLCRGDFEPISGSAKTVALALCAAALRARAAMEGTTA